MARLLRVAEVATGATEAVLHEWGVAEQAAFAVGDIIVTLETDKAVVDVEADDDGVLVVRLVPDGSQVRVGDPIGLLAAPGEHVTDVAAELARLGADAQLVGAHPPEELSAGAGVPALGAGGGEESGAGTRRPSAQVATGVARTHPEHVFASPLARRMAREAGLTVEDLTGTGPGGRIVKRDVRAAVERGVGTARRAERDRSESAPPSTGRQPDFVDVPHSPVRRTTAARLTESKQSTPHFYLRAGVRVTQLMALRDKLAEAGTRVSVNDLVVKAVALAHGHVPEMNVIWCADAVRSFSTVDVAVAVSTERGLLTPVLHSADSLALPVLASASRDLAERARTGTLRQHELEGGTVTVTNLGMFGVEEFTAIINPPQSAILAVGAITRQPVVVDNELAVEPVMRLVLAVDHRPMDGTVAAQWLRVLVGVLEQPLRLLL